MNYRSEIDGLRAVAVLPVVLFHAGFSVFSGGYVGVDVFFVISGYLITTIIVAELNEGQFSLLKFYERRARRILPALFFVLLVTFPFAWTWLQAGLFRDYSQSLWSVSAFISNVIFWMQSNYFGPGAETKPLLHTWSLAVEEQYYVLFPLAMIALWALLKLRVLWVLVLGTVASFLVCLWGAQNSPTANFYLAPFRAWELLVGSLCAVWMFRKPQGSNEALGLLGLALILYAIFAFDGETPFPSAYTLAPVLGTALIILFGQRATLVGRLLSLRGFVGIGLVSYSMYLWHQPLFVFARIRNVFEPPVWVMMSLALASLILAYISWRFVELPFRKGGRWGQSRQSTIFALSLVGLLGFAGLGAYGQLTDGRITGFGWNFDAEQRTTMANIVEMRQTHRTKGNSQFDDGACTFDTRYLQGEFVERIANCYARHGSGVMVLGDSHAIDLYGALSANAGEVKFLVGIVSGGCRPHSPRPGCPYEAVSQYLQENPDHFERVIYEQAGFHLLVDESGRSAARHQMRVPLSHAAPHFVPDTGRIARVVDYLKPLSEQTDLVWLGPRLAPYVPLEHFLYNGCDTNIAPREGQKDIYTRLDQEIAQQLAGSPVDYVSQAEMLPFELGSCGDLYWSDSDHFSESGEAYFGQFLSVLLSSENK